MQNLTNSVRMKKRKKSLVPNIKKEGKHLLQHTQSSTKGRGKRNITDEFREKYYSHTSNMAKQHL